VYSVNDLIDSDAFDDRLSMTSVADTRQILHDATSAAFSGAASEDKISSCYRYAATKVVDVNVEVGGRLNPLSDRRWQVE
jgi:hypothetical protein